MAEWPLANRRAIKVEILQLPDPDRRIEPLADEVDETIRVGGLDFQFGMEAHQSIEQRRHVTQTKGDRQRDAQAAHHLPCPIGNGFPSFF